MIIANSDADDSMSFDRHQNPLADLRVTKISTQSLMRTALQDPYDNTVEIHRNRRGTSFT